MAITVGVHTYATVAEADAYASARGWTDWDSLTEAQKEQRLIDAAVYLDTSYRWKGQITSSSQLMAWPRYGVKDAEGRAIASDAYPQRVKDAQVELARLASSALVTNETEAGLSALKAGEVSMTFKGSNRVGESERYRSVDRLLTGLFVRRAGSISNLSISRA